MCAFREIYLKTREDIWINLFKKEEIYSKIIFRRCNICISAGCAILKRNILYETLLVN